MDRVKYLRDSIENWLNFCIEKRQNMGRIKEFMSEYVKIKDLDSEYCSLNHMQVMEEDFWNIVVNLDLSFSREDRKPINEKDDAIFRYSAWFKTLKIFCISSEVEAEGYKKALDRFKEFQKGVEEDGNEEN